MANYKLGCVPYLNATPLIAAFEEEPLKSVVDIYYEVPSQLAKDIDGGLVDVALVSSFFGIGRSDLKVIANVSISSNGPVESVRLFSKKPFHSIESLALDQSSLTSTHLALIILNEVYKVRPHTKLYKPNLEDMLYSSDASVLIGDIGMSAAPNGLHVLDLGAAWQKLTGKPFVWALWIGRDKVDGDLATILLKAKQYGIQKLETIAQNESIKRGMPYLKSLRYLVEIMDYDLTNDHIEGLSLYAKYCQEIDYVENIELPVLIEASERHAI